MTVEKLVMSKGITRLCHFTPVRNLVHILAERQGLLSLEELAKQNGGSFNQQDGKRLDQHPNHISCSIEYPNVFYLNSLKRDNGGIFALFPDWVCLALNPAGLSRPGTKVAPRNAAAHGGALLETAPAETLEGLYAPSIAGAGGNTFTRGRNHLRACPTDAQAEVMVERAIPLSDIRAVIVTSDSVARRVTAIARQFDLDAVLPPVFVAPTLFAAYPLRNAVAAGQRPIETPWVDGDV